MTDQIACGSNGGRLSICHTRCLGICINAIDPRTPTQQPTEAAKSLTLGSSRCLEVRRILDEAEELVYPFEWSIKKPEENETIVTINSHELKPFLDVSEEMNYRLVFELWTFDEKNNEFIFGWIADDLVRNCVWNQLWFKIIKGWPQQQQILTWKYFYSVMDFLINYDTLSYFIVTFTVILLSSTVFLNNSSGYSRINIREDRLRNTALLMGSFSLIIILIRLYRILITM